MNHALGDPLTIEPSELLDEVKVFQKHRPIRSGGLRILIIAHRRTGILCHRCRRSKCGGGQQSHNTKYWEHAHDEVSPYSNLMIRISCRWVSRKHGTPATSPPRLHSAGRSSHSDCSLVSVGEKSVASVTYGSRAITDTRCYSRCE